MQRNNRLDKLEAAVGRAPRDIPAGEAYLYCSACIGPNSYRILIDEARARLKARGWNPGGPGPRWPPGQEPTHPSAAELAALRAAWVCRGCGAETMEGVIARVRREAGIT
jgi:hypothetical protein